MSCKLITALSRKKKDIEVSETKLNRVLGLFDLTALGVGATLGLGVYVLAGSAAKDLAGPAVAISFLVAAFASALAGLCYAEFASRVPKAGSAYVYSYVSVGEFIAYVIGWNLVMEYIIGTASVASGLTGYLDELSNHGIKHKLVEWLPISSDNVVSKYIDISPYFDIVSPCFIVVLTVLLAVGVQESTKFNNLFTALNVVTIITVLIGGAFRADVSNWRISGDEIHGNQTYAGTGGYVPFGWSGVMAGAAKVFFGFVGFDSIAATGEEAKNPQKDIPLAIVMSLLIVFLAYFGISTVLTLALPYYLQDRDAPLPYLFESLNMPVLKWIVTLGAACALCTSLIGAMFPLPRVLYAMGTDGVLFKSFAKVHPKLKTPLTATIVSGIASGLMAAVFNTDQLIDMMSIGTLLAYTIVAICVLLLRYRPHLPDYKSDLDKSNQIKDNPLDFFKYIFNLNNNKYANSSTASLTKICISLFCILSVLFCALLIFKIDDLNPNNLLIFLPFIFICVLLAINLIIISRQPADDIKLSFKVPCVPFLPCISVIINTYLMMKLNGPTWKRFLIWQVVGFCVYFFYGIFNSEAGKQEAKERSERKAQNSTTHQNQNGVKIVTKF